MDWASTSNLPAATLPNLPSYPFAPEYSSTACNFLDIEGPLVMEASDPLQVNPFTELSIGSGGSSIHSSSWRGRSKIKKMFSRSSSTAGQAKSAMKEGMSSWSLSGASKHVSPSPRRNGKLTDVARAGMRLLKGQGACWKCKILKKTVRKLLWKSSYQADKFSVAQVTPARNALPPPRRPGKKLAAKGELLVQTISQSSYALARIDLKQTLIQTSQKKKTGRQNKLRPIGSGKKRCEPVVLRWERPDCILTERTTHLISHRNSYLCCF